MDGNCAKFLTFRENNKEKLLSSVKYQILKMQFVAVREMYTLY